MTPEDAPEVFMNTFEWTVVAAGWPSLQWSAVLTLCLIGPAQQAMDSLPLQDLPNFHKVKKAMLQTLNLNPEAYQWRLWEIEFGTNYQSRLIAQRIKNTCLKWLCPSERTAEEVAQDVCMEHYVTLLPYKPKRWVTCHQPQILEDALLLMEA